MTKVKMERAAKKRAATLATKRGKLGKLTTMIERAHRDGHLPLRTGALRIFLKHVIRHSIMHLGVHSVTNIITNEYESHAEACREVPVKPSGKGFKKDCNDILVY